MAKFRYKLPDVENIKATGTAYLDVPLGDTLASFLCVLGGTTFNRSHITEVRVLINGKNILGTVSAGELHKLNLYRMSYDHPGALLIDFEEPRSRTFADQLAAIIGTAAGVNSLRLEWDIVGATAPTMTVYANATGPQALGLVPALATEEFDFVSTGKKTVRFPYALGPRETGGAGHILKRIHLVKSDGLDFADVTYKKNGVPVHDEVTTYANEFMQKHNESVPQADIYTIDFVEDNNTILNLVGTEDAASMYLQLNVSVVGHMKVIYEMMSPLEGI